jgi:NAD(P)-dependent dehydrogenase (short-subunit alcohol dehydrogenase family)
MSDSGRSDTVDGALLRRLFGLPGKVALVTGARQGLGRELALALAHAGASVAVTSRRPGELAEIARELGEIGVDHLELELEAGDAEHAERAVAAVRARFGRLDIVVNNAGRSIRKPALEHTLDDWDSVFEANLRGVFLLCRAAAPAMADGGRIVNISSTFAQAAYPNRVAYAASKAGLEQLTRALAVEWAGRGITVNAISLTTIETESRRDLFATPEARARRIAKIPLGRLGLTSDAIAPLLLLVGEGGAFITGHTLAVDGGFTLGGTE